MALPILWDTFVNRWHFTGRLVAKTGLHLGAGTETYDPVSTDLPVMKDELGNPYIPGSSLKGVIRARLEQLIRALEPAPFAPGGSWGGRGACDPLDERGRCVTNDDIKEIKKEQPNNWPEVVYERSCRICRLFGSPWIAGKFKITDLHMLSDTGAASEIRDGVSIDRDKGTVKDKYDFEVVVPGSEFSFEAVGENLDSDLGEPGLVLLALCELENGMIRVGGFKSRGLGVVELRDLTVTRVEAPTDPDKVRSYLQYVTGKRPPGLSDEEIGALINSCLSILVQGR